MRELVTWKNAAVSPGAATTMMDAAPRGDEVHQPLTVNPYDKPQFDPQQAMDYENGYQYAQSFGHQQLNQASGDEVERWSHAPIPWREGFAQAARRLGVGRLADMIEGSMKQSEFSTWAHSEVKTSAFMDTAKNIAVKTVPAWGAVAGYGVGHGLGSLVPEAMDTGVHPYESQLEAAHAQLDAPIPGHENLTGDQAASIEGNRASVYRDAASDLQDRQSGINWWSDNVAEESPRVALGVAGGTLGSIAGASVPMYRRQKRMEANPLPPTLKMAGGLRTLAGAAAGAAAPVLTGGLLGYEVGNLAGLPEMGDSVAEHFDSPTLAHAASSAGHLAGPVGMGALSGTMLSPYTALIGAGAGAAYDHTKEQDQMRKNRALLAHGMPIKTSMSTNAMNRIFSGTVAGGLLPIALGAGAGAGFGEIVDNDSVDHEASGALYGGLAGGAAGATLAPVGAGIGAVTSGVRAVRDDARIDRENKQWARMYPQGA